MTATSRRVDDRPAGDTLSQLARLLFDAAANKWYGSVGLLLFAGLGGAVLGALSVEPGQALADAVLFLVAYGLQFWAERQYDQAETMRRQSVFTEALGWPIGRVQMDEWTRRAGKRIRSRASRIPRPVGYYSAGQAELGAERLADMTAESAFYTRHLYGNL